MRRDGRRAPLVAGSWLIAVSLLSASGLAMSQPPAGFTATPCPPPDPAADARRAANVERVLTPTLPAKFWEAFAAAQSAGPAVPSARRASSWPGTGQSVPLQRGQCRRPARAQRLTAVFMGDSITEGWVAGDPALFTNGMVGRGFSAQTSPQMLVRFRQDVVALAPVSCTSWWGRTISQATRVPPRRRISKTTPRDDRSRARQRHRRRAGRRPAVAATLLARDLDPRSGFASSTIGCARRRTQQGLVFVDYATVLADADGGLRAELGNDGVIRIAPATRRCARSREGALTAALALSAAR